MGMLLRAFVKAVFVGTLAVALPPTALTCAVVAILYAVSPSSGANFATILFAFFPMAIALPIISLGTLVIGIPVHVLLQKTNYGQPGAYVLAGTMIGLSIIFMWSGLALPPLFLFGALGGGVTAYVWAQSFKEVQAADIREQLSTLLGAD